MASEIRIVLTDEGQIQLAVGGQAQTNKVLALGLLEMGKELFLHPPQPQSPIAIAQQVPTAVN